MLAPCVLPSYPATSLLPELTLSQSSTVGAYGAQGSVNQGAAFTRQTCADRCSTKEYVRRCWHPKRLSEAVDLYLPR